MEYWIVGRCAVIGFGFRNRGGDRQYARPWHLRRRCHRRAQRQIRWAATFSFISAATISGLQVWDTAATTAGNMLYFGTLATARILNAGDSLVFSVGALVITLA